MDRKPAIALIVWTTALLLGATACGHITAAAKAHWQEKLETLSR